MKNVRYALIIFIWPAYKLHIILMIIISIQHRHHHYYYYCLHQANVGIDFSSWFQDCDLLDSSFFWFYFGLLIVGFPKFRIWGSLRTVPQPHVASCQLRVKCNKFTLSRSHKTPDCTERVVKLSALDSWFSILDSRSGNALKPTSCWQSARRALAAAAVPMWQCGSVALRQLSILKALIWQKYDKCLTAKLKISAGCHSWIWRESASSFVVATSLVAHTHTHTHTVLCKVPSH